MLDNLGGNSWFTVLDQRKAYYQDFFTERSRPFTAFIIPWGLYEWLRIPFSPMNAPASLQHFVENCLSDLRDNICIPYLDDVIVFSKTFSDHLQHLRTVLRRLKEQGVKLKLKKCSFFKRQVTFLWRIISEQGYTIDPANSKPTSCLKEKPPKTAGEIRKVVGLLGY